MRIEGKRAGRIRPALVLLAGAAIVCATACYSSNYRKELAANTDLISELADKLADYCQAGFTIDKRQVSSEEMGEFYYALKKARGLSAATARASARASHRDFDAMLDAYAAFLRSADEYRLAAHPDPGRLAALIAQRRTVENAAARVRADLAREDG
ncbi:MAG TPA: hypothetical protein VMV27_06255 [Candidatus Binataceae bacterium]|nr:hypothetical protein [Candidatus Binataceae bacterium]